MPFFHKVSLALTLICLLGSGVHIPSAHAQETSPLLVPNTTTTGTDTFYHGEVTKIVSEEEQDNLGITGAPVITQVVAIRLLDGPRKNQETEITYSSLRVEQKLHDGEKVVVVAPAVADTPDTVYVFDRYRLSALYLIIGFFVVLTIILARWRGVTSLLGLAISVAILTFYVVPKILAGQNPLFVTLVGSLAIATLSIYLAHGFKRRTTIALISTLITICIAIGLAIGFVALTKLLGLGSEEAFYLQTAPVQAINLKGLLLGGIIIGALGVLDDVTTAQAAAVDELHLANPSLSPRELMRRGLSIGKEHITSLVNTLVLAYVGASFPTLLLFTIYQRPWWVVMNTELVAEEIVRTLVGSIALMCAVPITTLLAAYFLHRPVSVTKLTTPSPQENGKK